MPTPPRAGWTPGEFPSDARLAAALLLLYPGEHGPSIALTVRASGLRRHAGQISLPGGATDPGETLAQAALREAYEESASIPRGPHPRRTDAGPRARQRLHAPSDRRPDASTSGVRPAAHEVEAVIEVSVDDLQDASHIRHGTRTREGMAIDIPYFDLKGHQVWGATAMVLGEFICLL